MWISTIDCIPEEGQIVLAVDTTGDMSVSEFKRSVFWGVSFGAVAYENNGSWCGGPDRISGIVTHWMPLPLPPSCE